MGKNNHVFHTSSGVAWPIDFCFNNIKAVDLFSISSINFPLGSFYLPSSGQMLLAWDAANRGVTTDIADEWNATRYANWLAQPETPDFFRHLRDFLRMDHQPIDAVEERQEKVEKTEEKDNEKWTTGWKPKKKASPKLPIYLIDPAWIGKIWDLIKLFANDEKTNLYPPTSGKAS